MYYSKIFFIFLLLFAGFLSSGQEICDNGIDDDFDGLIDINDPDCLCEYLVPSSLIPNPSFEEQTCCPQENARLDCAVAWIQASAPTTDYVHTCANYLGNTSIPAYAPLPFPDGEGGVGFRDGQRSAGVNYKEYVGACLLEPMQVGTKYRLDFFVGFRDNVEGSMDFKIALFGSASCSNLPFGGNSGTVGCPLNSSGYVQIAEKAVSGSNEWINVVFEIDADLPYEVIVLGPNCAPNPNYQRDPYFYLDRLVLAESNRFGYPLDSIEGQICDEGVTLHIENKAGYSYQWYKDGIAIIGATGTSLFIENKEDVEGTYLCVLTTSEGCTISQKHEVRIPPYYESVNISVCEMDGYLFGSELLTETGYYERLIEAEDGCDSIVLLTLDVIENGYSEIQDTFCAGDSYSFLDINTSLPGTYSTSLPTLSGCDSIIVVELTEIPKGTGIQLLDQYELALGETIDIDPEYINPFYSGFKWLVEGGSKIASQAKLSSFYPLESTKLYLIAYDEYGCTVQDSTIVKVRKNNYELYVPNVFSPNNDGINDLFNFYPSISVDRILSIRIYDRWGNLVYENENIEGLGRIDTWDGSFNGQSALPGVYVYIIESSFIDGFKKTFSGDLTLIK